MKSVLMQSDLLTFIPLERIYWEHQAGQLAALEVTGSQWVRQVGITRRRRGSLSPAERQLVEALKGIAGGFGRAGQ